MPGQRSGCAGGEDGAGERCAAAGGDSPSCSLRAPRCRRRRAEEQGPSSGPPAPPLHAACGVGSCLVLGQSPTGLLKLCSSGAVPMVPQGAAALQTSTLALEPVWPAGKSWEAFSPCPWDCPAAGTEPQRGAGAGGSGCPPLSPQNTTGHPQSPPAMVQDAPGIPLNHQKGPEHVPGPAWLLAGCPNVVWSQAQIWLRAPGTARTPQGQKKGKRHLPGGAAPALGRAGGFPPLHLLRAEREQRPAAPARPSSLPASSTGRMGPAAHALTQKVPAAAGGRFPALFTARGEKGHN